MTPGFPTIGSARSASASEIVVENVRKIFGVTPEELRGGGRPARIAWARHAAAYAMRKIGKMSFQDCTNALGNSAHNAVKNSVKRVKLRLAIGAAAGAPEEDRIFREKVGKLLARTLSELEKKGHHG